MVQYLLQYMTVLHSQQHPSTSSPTTSTASTPPLPDFLRTRPKAAVAHPPSTIHNPQLHNTFNLPRQGNQSINQFYLLPLPTSVLHASQNMSTTTSPPSSTFTLLYFASATTFTHKPSDTFPAPLPLSQLFSAIEERYPGIKSSVLDSALVTVNLEYVDVPAVGEGEGEFVIKAGDEVAIIPPVSSG